MDSKLMKPLPKQLMLKDYLLDDLSSCSSSGFRSYPRWQCCTTVRFLLEIDLKNKYQPAPPPPYMKSAKSLLKSRPKPTPSSATVSAFQKASVAVINAVKHLPFAGVRSPLSSSPSKKKKKPMMKTIFPRSLSRKLKRSFWKRGDHKEIYWWTSFNRLDKEELKPPVFSPVLTAITAGDSNSSMSVSVSESKNKSNSNSWSDSDFTASSDNNSLQTSSGNSEVNSTETENNVVASKSLGTEKVINSKKVGATTGDDSPDSTVSSHGSITNSPSKKKHWPNEEKEQCSPVSILDCPFGDEDEVSSPFQHRLARVEGTTKKLMKKIQRFECLTQLEPLNLEKRIVSSESESESPLTNTSETEVEEQEKEEDKQTVESRALDLVQELKASLPSYNMKLKAEELLLDFFKGRILNASEHSEELTKGDALNNKLLQVAKDWINGKPIEVLLDWKVRENRMAYIRDIESRGEWKNTDLEKQEVILELEIEVFASLMNELLLDIIFS
ncbi:uncharacterized protein LOC107766122 [Nicotiana tabacum]|uniref:Uncharacterized protein LOC107766122 n=1 Tax=Nicotiana tabacum TaxID=4097 RepID=A0A1S3XK85_TOBAC|nr:PREDICTED: uncharacterized protein LOC107766122 [Nicotiana tabacum]